MPQDPLLTQLWSVPQDDGLRDLAFRYAPVFRFDLMEPFLPLAIGYTVFRQDEASPSYTKGRTLHLSPPGDPPATTAIA